MEEYFLLSFGIVVSLALFSYTSLSNLIRVEFEFADVAGLMKSHWQSSLKQKLFIRQPHWILFTLHIECQFCKEIKCKFKGLKLKSSVESKGVRRFYQHHPFCMPKWMGFIDFFKNVSMDTYWQNIQTKFTLIICKKDIRICKKVVQNINLQKKHPQWY